MENPMKKVARLLVSAIVLVSGVALSGCTEGVLDPKGPIAADERQILFNALGIMLAIVIPTILATLGVAAWFRASNKRARYLPDFEYSGRLEVLVWAIPATPPTRITDHQTDQRPGRFAGLEMALHLPGARHCDRQSTDDSRRDAGQLRADLLRGDEQLLRAAAWQPDLHDGGNGHAPSAAG